jgi:lipopolysaccharide transport system permease protein
MPLRQLDNLWQFRGFVLGSVRREFNARYRRSLLGGLWSVIAPLGTILIYVMVFSKLMNARLPGATSDYAYALYLCAGIISWGLFAETVNRCSGVFLENANLIKKLNFPRICLPAVAMLNALIHFGISLALFLAVLLVAGITLPSPTWLWVVPVLLVQLLFSAALGVLCGFLNVFFRDVGQALGLVLHFWFWATPIVYPASILPEPIARLLAWNPMTVIVEAYRQIFLQDLPPPLLPLALVFAAALLIGALAVVWYRRFVDEMVDEL